MSADTEGTDRSLLNKVVVRFPDGSVSGYANKEQWSKHFSSRHADARTQGLNITLQREETSPVEIVSLADAKAVFFVNSFEGNREQKDIRFHDDNPLMQKIWVRLTFADGEVLEGMIENTLDHLCDVGFYLQPTDPAGNNYLAYILKKQVVDFKVLGLRNETITANR